MRSFKTKIGSPRKKILTAACVGGGVGIRRQGKVSRGSETYVAMWFGQEAVADDLVLR